MWMKISWWIYLHVGQQTLAGHSYCRLASFWQFLPKMDFLHLDLNTPGLQFSSVSLKWKYKAQKVSATFSRLTMLCHCSFIPGPRFHSNTGKRHYTAIKRFFFFFLNYRYVNLEYFQCSASTLLPSFIPLKVSFKKQLLVSSWNVLDMGKYYGYSATLIPVGSCIKTQQVRCSQGEHITFLPLPQENNLLHPILGALCHLLIQNTVMTCFTNLLVKFLRSVIAFVRAGEKVFFAPTLKSVKWQWDRDDCLHSQKLVDNLCETPSWFPAQDSFFKVFSGSHSSWQHWKIRYFKIGGRQWFLCICRRSFLCRFNEILLFYSILNQMNHFFYFLTWGEMT